MYICPECNSTKTIKKGKTYRDGIINQRFKCKNCDKNFYDSNDEAETYYKSKSKKWVIVSALNNSTTNYKFLSTLEHYCEVNHAELLVVPLKYQLDSNGDYSWDVCLENYLVNTEVFLTKDIKLLANINISPTSSNPLSAFDNFSKGISLIIPSPQIMMKTVAVNHVDLPAILYTTGCISDPNYSSTKIGERAKFNHSYSALIVEEDPEIDSFHIRVLNSSIDGSFYDLDKFYSGHIVNNNNRISAIVLGDEHVVHLDKNVKYATFDDEKSICNVLNPEYLIRHDVLDFESGNHHHKNDFLTNYKKYSMNTNKVENELFQTAEYILNTTKEGSTSIIVDSNHNAFFHRWLNESNPKNEFWNAKFYHKMMYLALDAIEKNDFVNMFQLWFDDNYNDEDVVFVTDESFKLHDIELGLHGHAGINSSRGSSAQFSRLGHKTVQGHSHSPSIHGSSYCVGTSSVLKMEYNKGPSSWHHAHCLIHPNGKRQMIFINKGKWRA